MFVAIAVAAMTDVPAEMAGLASGLLMTGHEIGAALGVAGLTAIAGDLATHTGLVHGYGRALAATAGLLVALFILAATALPGRAPTPGPGPAA